MRRTPAVSLCHFVTLSGDCWRSFRYTRAPGRQASNVHCATAAISVQLGGSAWPAVRARSRGS